MAKIRLQIKLTEEEKEKLKEIAKKHRGNMTSAIAWCIEKEYEKIKK